MHENIFLNVAMLAMGILYSFFKGLKKITTWPCLKELTNLSVLKQNEDLHEYLKFVLINYI